MTIRGTLLCLGIYLFTISLGWAQNRPKPDVVMMQNGDRWKGTLLDYQKGQSLALLLSTGDTLKLGAASLGSIQGISIGSRYYKHNNKGLWGHAEMGLNFGENNYGVLVDGGSMMLSGGYKWGRLGAFGVGIAREAFTDIKTVPIFLAYNGDWYNNKTTPYHFVQIGHSFGKDAESNPDFKRFEDVSGGFRMNLGVGLKIKGPNTHFTLGIGYLMQEATFERRWWGGWPNPGNNNTAIDYRTFRRLAVRIGISI